ncbi:hypothetical protein ACMGD3_19825 [Lysinibacillus sphaericus]|uniref:hypothetical protein n=1 Tax=Lysinibacillus sphaericus TaxID=1421 RepID=UPI003F79DB96
MTRQYKIIRSLSKKQQEEQKAKYAAQANKVNVNEVIIVPNGKHYLLVVPECFACGLTHFHGEGLGSRVGHTRCVVDRYDIKIDWSDEENIRLAKRYNIGIKEAK